MTRPYAAPDPEDARQWLSDMADGRLDDAAVARACQCWSDDGEARRTWHAYQLIGDVMRSDDLARPAAGDVAFLQGLRLRLADEPVVLAPAPAPAPTKAARSRQRQLWLVPMAAAAGFVAVAGVLVVLQQAAPGGNGFDAAQMAAVPPAAGSGRATLASSNGLVMAQPSGVVTHLPRGQMLRDARVDEYLRAHREVMMGSPAALPGGAVRTVDFEAVPSR